MTATDQSVATHFPVPLLTLPTAVRDTFTLLTTFHGGGSRRIQFQCPTSVTRRDAVLIPRGRGGRRPAQILFRFFLTQRRLGRGCVFAKLGVQSHNVIAVFLTRGAAVVKVPAFGAAVRMRLIGRFNIGTGGRRTLGKVPPPLRSLIFRIPHEADGKEFALHRIASVAKDRGLFVENGIAGEAWDRTGLEDGSGGGIVPGSGGSGWAALGFHSFENVFPSSEHVPILVENIQHGTTAEHGNEFGNVNGNGEIVKRIPGFAGDRGEEFLAFEMDNGEANVSG